MPIDDSRLQSSLVQLRSADLTSGELEASLRVVVTATQQIFDADGAGLMIIDDQEALHHVGATDARSAAFEAAQEECGEGPCVDSLVLDVVVSTDDLGADPRWPQLQEMIGGLGIGAMLGVPIHIGGSTIGSLNVFRTRPGGWDDSEVSAIGAHARVIEETLGAAMLAHGNSRLVDQLTHALENRVSIERAVGIVMARRDLDPTRAFNHLRLRARNERRTLREVADEVVDGIGVRPDPRPDQDQRV